MFLDWKIDWQTLIALGVVVFASVVLLRNVRNWLRGTGRSGCSVCPSRAVSPVKTIPLVQISPTQQRDP